MTMAGMRNRRLASAIVPNEGVSPPKNRLEQSSTRSAPPASASRASSRDPQQISSSTRAMSQILAWFAPRDADVNAGGLTVETSGYFAGDTHWPMGVRITSDTAAPFSTNS